MLTPSQIIVLAVPVFFLLIAIEWFVSVRRKKYPYQLADALSSMSLGLLSQTSGVFTKLLSVGIYVAIFEHIALYRNDAFWLSIPGWIIALIFYDFCYYWFHRVSHEVNVLWASHAVHHQSQQFNLSTALRQTSTGSLLGWIFFVPMAIAGVPPLVFIVVALIDLLYQYWVHTEQIRKLGWFDRWFCAPSNHRVHHAVNDQYLDKNYGGILIIWDRIFGTYKDEDDNEPCVYGTRGLLNSWDPLWANAANYGQLAQDSWHARNWLDKLRVWFKHPGWRPADVAGRFPKPPFVLDEHRVLFNPPLTRAIKLYAWVQFVALGLGFMLFLWNVEQRSLATNLIWFATLTVSQWALGACLQRRISLALALMLSCAALAVATGSLGTIDWHMVFKPAAMLCALAHVLNSRDEPSVPRGWLIAGLVCSLAGDSFLMFNSPSTFLPGLVSFLLAHVAYLIMLKRGVPWFPRRGILAITLVLGVAMYSVLWLGGLPVELRIPVAIYVLMITLMAAQAWGRYTLLGNRAALQVAVGASFFMLSDSLLALDLFVQPLPYALFWVLVTYYAAQALIVHGSTQSGTGKLRAQEGNVQTMVDHGFTPAR